MSEFELLDVLDAKHARNGLIDMTLRARIRGEEMVIPFSYAPNDEFGLGPAVREWWGQNPQFPISDADPVVIPVSDVWAERDRRLAGGFDYDFGDVRGVHRINTTPADMIGWDEVTKFAQALINAGQGAQVITIATGSGVTQLTANEWQGVLIAAAAFRQPIWGASFVIEQMGEIPADFANDAYWTA